MNTKREEGQDGKYNGEIHPLLIDHIAKKIFYFVLHPTQPNGNGNNYYKEKRRSKDAISTLASARLVCRLWYKLATPILKKCGPSPKFGCETTDIPWKPDSKMKCFLRTVKASKIMPVEKYTLNPLVLAQEHNHQLMETFIDVCAPNAVSLDLQLSPFQRAHFSGLERSVLRLKKFVKFILNRRKKASGIEVTEKLLSSAINLEELSISMSIMRFYTSEEMSKIQSHLNSIVMVIPSTVTDLCLHFFSTLRYPIAHLIKLNLKLESLDFRVCGILGGNDFERIEIIRKFFVQQSLTLRRLTLFAEAFYTDWMNEAIEPLQFPKVIFLALKSYGDSFERLPLYQLFPNLLSLNLKNFKPFSDRNVKFLLSLEKESQSVEELILPSDHLLPWEDVVRKMGRVFPNLKRLHFPLENYYNKTFQDISVCFPNLQLLTCDDGKLEQTCDSVDDANEYTNITY